MTETEGGGRRGLVHNAKIDGLDASFFGENIILFGFIPRCPILRDGWWR